MKRKGRKALRRLTPGSAGHNAAYMHMDSYNTYIRKLASSVDSHAVADLVGIFINARDAGATIFFIGNGGSAATASHFAQDLAEISRKTPARPFRTICLCDSMSHMTALANDYGYEKVFTGQMLNLFRKGDCLVAISASGKSRNILDAVTLAKRMRGTTVGLVGFDGGMLKKICDHTVHVPTRKGEYGPVEDVHLMIDHMICGYLSSRARRKAAGSA